MSINGRRRLKSDKHSILHNTTVSSTQAFGALKCGKEHQMLIDGLSNAFNDERYFMKKNLYNDDSSLMLSSASLSSSPTLNIKNSTYNAKSDKFDVKYRPNRKLGMLVIISGFYSRNEK